LPYDHVHLAAPDQAKAVEWYQKMFGGQTTPEGKDRLLFGKTRFIWLKSETAQPSANTAIDHIGLSFADLDAKMKEWEAVGVKVITPLRPVPGLVKIGFIEDPWGVKIEVVQDTETLGFHHVHLRSPDPAASMAWYKQRFGGETAKLKGLLDGLKYGDVWVLFAKGDATPSVGHALDHVGWRVANLDKTLDDLKGIKVLQGVTPLQLATGPVRFSFVEDPSGTKIELVQR
jgi:catechol 2,3-dioxygenase-like lactoylglutathione lyase family enzyme